MPRSRRCDLSPQSETIKSHELVYSSTEELGERHELEDSQGNLWQDPADEECHVYGRLSTARVGDK